MKNMHFYYVHGSTVGSVADKFFLFWNARADLFLVGLL